MVETGAQNGAGGDEQNVRRRDQTLHNPSAQRQGSDLIASRRRRWRRRCRWELEQRRRQTPRAIVVVVEEIFKKNNVQ